MASANYAKYMSENLNYKLARFQKAWENFEKEHKAYSAWYNKVMVPRKRNLERLKREHTPFTRTQQAEWNTLYSNNALTHGEMMRTRRNRLRQKSQALQAAYLPIKNIVPGKNNMGLRWQIGETGRGINSSVLGSKVYNLVTKLRAIRGGKHMQSLIRLISKVRRERNQSAVRSAYLSLVRGTPNRPALPSHIAAGIVNQARRS